jgi:hypothetical protein
MSAVHKVPTFALSRRDFGLAAMMVGMPAGFTSLINGPSFAQALTGAPAAPNLKYSTAMPPGIASPDKVETRFGTLNFFDGFPDNASAEKLFDNLDFQRAVQAYLMAIPARSAKLPTGMPFAH